MLWNLNPEIFATKVLQFALLILFTNQIWETAACEATEPASFWESILGDDYLQGPKLEKALTEKDEVAQCFLKKHNSYRKAAGLTEFTWNQTIANLAFETSKYFESSVLLCDGNHRKSFNSEHWVGENIHLYGRFPALMEDDLDMCARARDGVKNWYREIQAFTYPLGGKGPFHACSGEATYSKYGHFVQMMLAKTTQIGCSYASCIRCLNGVEYPNMIFHCYYNQPVLKNGPIFADDNAQKLHDWKFNAKYGGLKNCTPAAIEA